MAIGIAGTYGPHRLPRVLANMDASMRALAPETRQGRPPLPLALVTRPRESVFGDADLLSRPR